MKTMLLSLLLTFPIALLKAQELKVEKSLWSKDQVKQMNAQVFKDCPQYQEENLVNLDIEFCARFEIIEVIGNEIPPFELFSKVILKGKCNPNFQHQALTFDAKTFNPLHYFFMIKSDQTKWYKVDNTNLFIKINPTK
jgi:hypothetical protein